MPTATITIISDAKPGHLAQARGLADALAHHTGHRILEIDITQPGQDTPRPANDAGGLVIATGRATRRPALVVARQAGLLSVALMNPGWWLRRKFDLCAIPRHDGVAQAPNVITTEGALNGIRPAPNASADQALLLVGGPSKHHGWDDTQLNNQLTQLLERDPQMRWTVTSSRRTPGSTDTLLHACAQRFGDRFAYTPAAQTPRGWVAEQLQRCGTSWVTEDSVSMVYESLTAGARVGLLDVPRLGKPGRVVRGVESLVQRGWVTAYNDWCNGQPLATDRPPLAEADRVAGVILDRWPNLKP